MLVPVHGVAAKHDHSAPPRRTESRSRLPIAQIMTRANAGRQKIRDLILLEPALGQPFRLACTSGPWRRRGYEARRVARSAGKHLAAKTRILVHLQHVNAGVRHSGVQQHGERFFPRGGGLSGKSGDQIDVRLVKRRRVAGIRSSSRQCRGSEVVRSRALPDR